MAVETLDLVCFSHLRWNFVFQRPQHLLTRFSTDMRVFYVEEPIIGEEADFLNVTHIDQNLWVIVPHLRKNLSEQDSISRRKDLLSRFFKERSIKDYIFWYYTPMALPISSSFNPRLIVYDCMDELSAFKFAPPELQQNEEELFKQADLVFTGGQSLYEAKKHRHRHIYAFPSSIDKEHFQKARLISTDPQDQAAIPHPRIGFYGVIDERMDLELIEKVASKKPAWQFVLIGPVVKIDQSVLPRRANIHYLGSKTYLELPSYLSGWDISMIPFALNESTRFISPTKTPEYLSAGKPVISSSIQDVVRPYGDKQLVNIADTPQDFIKAVNKELAIKDRKQWLKAVDAFLEENSWDLTWKRMMHHISSRLADKAQDKKKFNSKFKSEHLCLII